MNLSRKKTPSQGLASLRRRIIPSCYHFSSFLPRGKKPLGVSAFLLVKTALLIKISLNTTAFPTVDTLRYKGRIPSQTNPDLFIQDCRLNNSLAHSVQAHLRCSEAIFICLPSIPLNIRPDSLQDFSVESVTDYSLPHRVSLITAFHSLKRLA